MRYRAIILIAAAGGIGVAGNAAAQASCSDVLKDGVFQTADYRQRNYFNQIIWSRFIKSTYETAKNDRSLGFGVPVGEIVLGGTFNEAEYEAKKASISKEYFSQINTANEIDVALTSGDPVILEKWAECMRNQAGGLTIRFDAISARQAFVNIQYYPQGVRHQIRLASDVVMPPGVRVVDGLQCFRRRTAIVAGNVCRARIEVDLPQRPVPLVVNGDAAGAQGFLPARVVLATQRRPLAADRLPQLRRYAHRATYDEAHLERLTATEVGQGWRFIPSSAQAQLVVEKQTHWANKCEGEYARATLETFSYGYHIYGKSKKGDRARNGSVTCSINASIVMTRDIWQPQRDTVPIGEALADDNEEAPGVGEALRALSGVGRVSLPAGFMKSAVVEPERVPDAVDPEPDLDGAVSLWTVPAA